MGACLLQKVVMWCEAEVAAMKWLCVPAYCYISVPGEESQAVHHDAVDGPPGVSCIVGEWMLRVGCLSWSMKLASSEQEEWMR